MFILRETKNWLIPYILDQDLSGQQEDPIGVFSLRGYLELLCAEVYRHAEGNIPPISVALLSFCLADAVVATALCNMAHSHGERC